MTAKSGPLISTVLLRQAQLGHGPRCLGCAAVRVEAAAIDHADREVELLEAEAEANAAGQKPLATARAAVATARPRIDPGLEFGSLAAPSSAGLEGRDIAVWRRQACDGGGCPVPDGLEGRDIAVWRRQGANHQSRSLAARGCTALNPILIPSAEAPLIR